MYELVLSAAFFVCAKLLSPSTPSMNLTPWTTLLSSWYPLSLRRCLSAWVASLKSIVSVANWEPHPFVCRVKMPVYVFLRGPLCPKIDSVLELKPHAPVCTRTRSHAETASPHSETSTVITEREHGMLPTSSRHGRRRVTRKLWTRSAERNRIRKWQLMVFESKSAWRVSE